MAWNNPNEYDKHAIELAGLFSDNFKTYGESVSYMEDAGPIRNNEIVI